MKKIEYYLKQRFPFLMIDRIAMISSDKIEGIKNISLSDNNFSGQYPLSIFWILELMGQMSEILIREIKKEYCAKIVLSKINNFIFEPPLDYVASLKIKCKLDFSFNNHFQTEAGVYLNEQKISGCILQHTMI
ncbi:MAG: hypothetical protein JEY91_02255 [Spirochaetaceae bacterium]|nr:hypothetical protein [Spirochaetaceae bacterium]